MRAILFDLDGTLLDLDSQEFFTAYFSELERVTSAALGQDTGGAPFMKALREATTAMTLPHPGTTNCDIFYSEMFRLTGIDPARQQRVFHAFYQNVFPLLADKTQPARGARRAVETARSLGLRLAIATNPVFPLEAVTHRLAWAGLGDISFDVLTSFEFMEACKPHPSYFSQIAQILKVQPSECLMVGDDRVLDMSAADIGMRTYYVGEQPYPPHALQGTLDALADLLPQLVNVTEDTPEPQP